MLFSSAASFTSDSSPINSTAALSSAVSGSPKLRISSSISLNDLSMSLEICSISISIPNSSSVAGSSSILAFFSGP